MPGYGWFLREQGLGDFLGGGEDRDEGDEADRPFLSCVQTGTVKGNGVDPQMKVAPQPRSWRLWRVGLELGDACHNDDDDEQCWGCLSIHETKSTRGQAQRGG